MKRSTRTRRWQVARAGRGGVAFGLALVSAWLLVPVTAAAQWLQPGPGQPQGENIAVGKTATQSSVDFGGGPQRAVDGNTDGSYHSGSSFHTSREVEPWWSVDLGAPTELTSLVLYNRIDCCAHLLENVTVQVADDPSFQQLVWESPETAGNLPGPTYHGVFPQGTTGRHVRIRIRHLNPEYSHLAEVEIYGQGGAPDAVAETGPATAWLQPGPGQPQGQNIAVGKTAIQSSLAWGGDPQRAVDGNTEGNYGLNSVSHTDREMEPWWSVDLGEPALLDTLVLYNRTDCCAHLLENVTVQVADDPGFQQLVWESPETAGSLPDRTYYGAFPQGTTGRHVRVRIRHPNPEYSHLAEVEVYGLQQPPEPLDMVIETTPIEDMVIETTPIEVLYASIAGRVHDADVGLGGVQVTLVEMGASTYTAADGTYAFSDLPGGYFTVRVTAPAGLDPASDPDSALDHQTVVAVNPGDNRTGVDFGYGAPPPPSEPPPTETVATQPLCRPGTFGPGGFEPCRPCPLKTFAATAGASECETCPAGTVSSPGSTECASSEANGGYIGCAVVAFDDQCSVEYGPLRTLATRVCPTWATVRAWAGAAEYIWGPENPSRNNLPAGGFPPLFEGSLCAHGIVQAFSTDDFRCFRSFDPSVAIQDCHIWRVFDVYGVVSEYYPTQAPPVTPEAGGSQAGWLAPGAVQSVGTNLALGRTATQSPEGLSGHPARAVDGNTSGDWNRGSVTATDTGTTPWWTVDLGGVAQLESLVLYNRTDCCQDRPRDVTVMVSREGDPSFQNPASFETAGVLSEPTYSGLFPAGFSGRYIRIQSHHPSGGYLSLAEVEVYGTGEPASIAGAVRLEDNGVSDVTVTVVETGALATTGPDGGYSFSDLPPGSYTVRVTAPAGTGPASDLDGTLDHQTTVALNPGSDSTGVDFGYLLTDGCFTDYSIRHYDQGGITAAICHNHCKKYTYEGHYDYDPKVVSGAVTGGSCYCGRFLNQVADENCLGTPCPGDRGEDCGAVDYYRAFSLSGPEPEPIPYTPPPPIRIVIPAPEEPAGPWLKPVDQLPGGPYLAGLAWQSTVEEYVGSGYYAWYAHGGWPEVSRPTYSATRPEESPWFTIDLGAVSPLHKVVLQNAPGKSLHNISVAVANDPGFESVVWESPEIPGPLSESRYVGSFPANTEARYVRIRSRNPENQPAALKLGYVFVTGEKVQPSEENMLSSWLNKLVSIQPYTATEHRVRHRDSLGRTDPAGRLDNVQLGKDFGWHIEPVQSSGASGEISFKSANHPHRYLAHTLSGSTWEGYRLKLLEPTRYSSYDRDDMTFMPLPALNGAEGFVSFLSTHANDRYIRHRDSELWMDENDGSQEFRNDASFKVTDPIPFAYQETGNISGEIGIGLPGGGGLGIGLPNSEVFLDTCSAGGPEYADAEDDHDFYWEGIGIETAVGYAGDDPDYTFGVICGTLPSEYGAFDGRRVWRYTVVGDSQTSEVEEDLGREVVIWADGEREFWENDHVEIMRRSDSLCREKTGREHAIAIGYCYGRERNHDRRMEWTVPPSN